MSSHKVIAPDVPNRTDTGTGVALADFYYASLVLSSLCDTRQ
jgi:hypothetical protein